MNRMWSVLIRPYLVDDGRAFDQRQQVALHALARHVGAAAAISPRREATLSISSMKTMPFCSALWMAAARISSSLTSLAGFLVDQQLHRLARS